MKPLSSFSSPSSCNGGKTPSSASGKRTTAAAGCIARLLRHILCLRSLSACPFDYLKEDGKERLLDGSTGSTIPGVVARLMGLESLPLIGGSPSTDSARSYKKLKPPRVRRGWIIPIAYREDQDDNFFIFSFEADVERRRSRKRTSTARPKDGVHENMDFTGCDALRPLENLCGENLRKTEPKFSCEIEDKSENSSPGSALEFVGFPTHDQQASSSFSSSGDVSRLRNSRMRRTLSEELDKCDSSKDTKTNGAFMIDSNGFVGRQKLKHHWNEIEREVTKLSWVEDEIYRNHDYLMEICRDVSSQILGQLLDELLLSTLNIV